MEIKETPNPVGKPIPNPYIDMFIDSMKAIWDSTKIKNSWYNFWGKTTLTPVTDFLLKCLDDLIEYVDQIDNISGSDKKATVLAAIGIIYDYIIREAMPIWLRPFSTYVRNYVINILISHAIDWIIEKYRKGYFKPKTSDQLEAQWVILYGQTVGLPKITHK